MLHFYPIGGSICVPKDGGPSWSWFKGFPIVCSLYLIVLLNGFWNHWQIIIKWQGESDSIIPPFVPLSSEHVSDEGIYLLENGEDCLVYIGNSVDPNILRQLFGFSSVDEVPSQVILFYLFIFKMSFILQITVYTCRPGIKIENSTFGTW